MIGSDADRDSSIFEIELGFFFRQGRCHIGSGYAVRATIANPARLLSRRAKLE